MVSALVEVFDLETLSLGHIHEDKAFVGGVAVGGGGLYGREARDVDHSCCRD